MLNTINTLATLPASLSLQATIKSLPHLPGVYRFFDQQGTLLYVGKALDLKKRVASYFRGSSLSPRILFMIRRVSQIETTVTRSESEALILEYELIQNTRPRYNIVFRDDKSYPYLKISDHAFAQVSYFRGNPKKTDYYFGPYPSSDAVRNSIELLERIFQLRTCEDMVFNNRSRPCLLYQIKRCSAPCVGKISQHQYQNNLQDALLFLKGQRQHLLRSLSDRMNKAALGLDFESAALWRDHIQALTKIQEKQFVSQFFSKKRIDVIAVAVYEEDVGINLTMIHYGRHLGDRSLFPLNADPLNLQASLEAFVMHYYSTISLPDIVIVEQVLSNTLVQYLCEQSHQTCSFVVRPKGEKLVWLKMAKKNAQLALVQKCSSKVTALAQHQSLKTLLNLEPLNHIECFDVSHMQGQNTVAACVVYKNRTFQTTDYRRYLIRSAKGGDDCAAMKEALFRRYGDASSDPSQLPDLILIDGGIGQMKAAEEVLKALSLVIPLVGIAKNPNRETGMETLILSYAKKCLRPAKDQFGFLLIQAIRDEAHRFALYQHRARQNHVRSSLEEIPHIGPKRRRVLLTHFKGLRELMGASVENLAKIDHIGLLLAEKIYQALHQ